MFRVLHVLPKEPPLLKFQGQFGVFEHRQRLRNIFDVRLCIFSKKDNVI